MEQKKILICSYRNWANNVKDLIFLNYQDCELTWIQSKAEFKEKAKGKTYDLVLFIGWSWIVPKNFISRNTCVCFHPSDLPKYRGGSPIQNQIIRGEKNSAVTLFLMSEKMDAGPIVFQESMSLSGSLDDIFNRIAIFYVFIMFLMPGTYFIGFGPKFPAFSMATHPKTFVLDPFRTKK